MANGLLLFMTLSKANLTAGTRKGTSASVWQSPDSSPRGAFRPSKAVQIFGYLRSRITGRFCNRHPIGALWARQVVVDQTHGITVRQQPA